MRRPRIINDVWFPFRIVLGSNRAGHRLLARRPRADRRQWVAPGTDACIEGFPRSGNTYATRTFREWNPEVRVAHHTHLPGQLLAANELGIPAALLIRDPLDAVASVLVFNEGSLSARAGVLGYIAFHRPLLPILDRLAICPFNRLIANSAHVVESLNARFGTGFHGEYLVGEQRDEVLARIARMQRRRGHSDASTTSVPNIQREQRKQEARARVEQERSLADARLLYRDIKAAADP